MYSQVPWKSIYFTTFIDYKNRNTLKGARKIIKTMWVVFLIQFNFSVYWHEFIPKHLFMMIAFFKVFVRIGTTFNRVIATSH